VVVLLVRAVLGKPGAPGRGKVELGEGAGDARWPTGQVFGGHGCHGRKQRREKGEGLRRKLKESQGSECKTRFSPISCGQIKIF